jgi:alpha-amylase
MSRLTILLVLLGCASIQQRPATSAAGRTDWRRGAVCYEIFVRSFFDSDGDGIGDLNGITQKLDYINDGSPKTKRDLGARCIWLMPVAESPSYHGYDVADYYRVDAEYGTIDDFKRLIAEAHRRGIKVLVDMVLNHASSEHVAFKEALRDPTSRYREWFRWSPTKPAEKGPWGQEVWHKSPLRDEYYYGIFWRGMPDLNYEHAAVREEAKKVATFWLTEMGVDGFRLDAIPYLVEEGGRVNGSPGTHAFLREYAVHVKRVAPSSFTIGEVWDSVGAMLPYYPDQLDAHFAFELSEAIVKTVLTGSARDLYTGYLRLQRNVPAERWSPFLRNHDQVRTLTVLGGDVERNKLAVTMLLTLPGLPFVYYGEEIGMTGNKPDERLRTPMQWSGAPNGGFTTGKPWALLQRGWQSATVEAQEADSSSLLALHRRLIHLRDANEALGSGELIPMTTTNDGIAAYLRRGPGASALVVHNLGSTPLTGLRVSSVDSVLPPGRYRVTDLFGGATGASLTVSGLGRVDGYAVTLAPLQSLILGLTRY